MQPDVLLLGQAHVGPQLTPTQLARSKSGSAQISPGRSMELGPSLGLPSWGLISFTFVFGWRKCVIRQAEPELDLGLAQPNTSGMPKVCPLGPHSELLAGLRCQPPAAAGSCVVCQSRCLPNTTRIILLKDVTRHFRLM